MRSGFTLVEVVVVITVIAILSAFAIPIVNDRIEGARRSSAMRELLTIERVCRLHKTTYGDWPPNSHHSIVPPEIASDLDMDFGTTPLGGTYDWNGPGTSIGHLGISIRFPNRNDVPLSELMQIDAEIDDGDLASGTLRLLKKIYFQLCVEP